MSLDHFLAAFQTAIPSLDHHKNHKGQHGRIGVIGGCKEYTGAPYFAAISALRSGADLVHIFCTSDAAIPIKSYSPELIVHPVLNETGNPEWSDELKYDEAKDYVFEWMGRLHALVVGPGLGRNKQLIPFVSKVVERAKQKSIPIVFDADGLYYISSIAPHWRGYEKAIITPNAIEFDRLFETFTTNGECFPFSRPDKNAKSLVDKAKNLSAVLGNVTFLVKGSSDIITNGHSVVINDEPGSGRRCGGQGDILSGAVGTFASWCNQSRSVLGQLSPEMTSCVAASILTRTCNLLAFKKHGRSMITSDMIKMIGTSFETRLAAKLG